MPVSNDAILGDDDDEARQVPPSHLCFAFSPSFLRFTLDTGQPPAALGAREDHPPPTGEMDVFGAVVSDLDVGGVRRDRPLLESSAGVCLGALCR